MMKSLIKSNAVKGQTDKANQVVQLLQTTLEGKPPLDSGIQSKSPETTIHDSKEISIQKNESPWKIYVFILLSFLTGLLSASVFGGRQANVVISNLKKELEILDSTKK